MASDVLHRLLRTSTWTALAEVGPDEALLRVNPAFALHLERPAEALLGTSFADHLTTPDAERFRAWMAGEPLPVEPVLVNLVSGRGAPFTLRCLVEPTVAGMLLVGEPTTELDRPAAEEILRVSNELATMARERGRRERELEKMHARLEAALEELRTSYWHLQKIQEVLPVCMECGKVRTGDTDWQTVADYMKANDIFVSHGYCPACAAAYSRAHGLGDPEP